MLTCCMIVQDEEEYVARALDSIYKYVDGIKIIDGGSTDRTMEIISNYDKVELRENKWPEDFSIQKNLVTEMAPDGWVLWCDADDYWEPYICDRFQELMQYGEENEVDAFGFIRHTITEKNLVNIFERDYQKRLYRSYCRWEGELHEYLIGYNKYKETCLTVMHQRSMEMQKRSWGRYPK